MANGVNIATAYLTLVPTLQGAQGQIAQQMSQIGGVSGQAWADQFTRDANGRLRDQRGRFVAEGEEIGNQMGQGMGAPMGQQGQRSSESFLGSFKDKALAGIGGVAVAVGAAFVAAYNEALDVRAAGAKLQANLGISPEESAKFGKLAGKLYAQNYGESISEVTATIGTVASSIKGLDDASLERTTAKAISFAQAFDTDVSTAVQNVSTLVGSGLVKSSDEAFDLLTKSSQKVPEALRGSVADASDEYAQFFRTLGFSGQDAFGALVKGAEKGEFGIDKTGDAIKEFTLLSTDMSEKTVGAYESIGLNATDMTNAILSGGDSAKGAFDRITDGILGIQDPAAQSQAALALFGTPLEDMNVQDIPQFIEGLKGMSGGMGDAAGAADQMDAAMGSTASGLDTLWRNIKATLVDFITDKVLPAVTAFTQWLGEKLVPVVQDVSAWLGDHLGPVLQKVASFFVDVLLPAGQAAWAWFEENLLPTIQRVGQFIADTFANLTQILGGIIDFIAGVFTGDWSRVWEGIKTIFSGIWDQIGNIISLAWDLVTGIGGKILDWLGQLPGWAWDRIKAFAGFITEKGKEFLQWLWDGITTKAEEVWAWFTSLPGRAWDALVGFVGAGGGWLIDRGSEFIGWLIDGIKSGASSLWSWITGPPTDANSLLGGIWNSFLSIGSKLLEFGGKVVGWIVDGIKAGIGKVADAITGLFDDLTFNPDGTISTPDGYVTANPFAGGSARGGVIPGTDPGRRDNVLARLPDGRLWGLRSEESVFVPEFTRAIGGAATVNAWNRAAEQGRLSDYGFARGGVVDYGTTMAELTGQKMVGGGDPWAKTLVDSVLGKAKELLGALWSNLFGSSISGGLNPSQSGIMSQVTGGAFPPNVERWRPLMADVLAKVGAYKGLNLSGYVDRGLMQINSESSGDPNAINNYDINAQRGDPSIGLLQVIGSTFRNALRGTPFESLIALGQRDPRASLTASTLYSLGRYTTLDRAWRGVAYAKGGIVPDWWGGGVDSVPALLTPGEGVFTPPQTDAILTHAKAIESGYWGGAVPTIEVYIGGEKIDERIEVRVVDSLNRAAGEVRTLKAQTR